ncbi:heat shock protein HspQ [Sphingopyxis sp. OPL5]|jgi:heat shock protein HspQ|nr:MULTISPECIES: heat shock protein HspQ [unclassified Sphingopyxis]QNO29723.1 heat shock protein HspQ [Sphingopyxis sp. OPL5]
MEFPASAPKAVVAPLIERARFAPGDIVRHRLFDFRGVVFDIDPVFSNSDEWYDAIPEGMRPAKEQPFYHLLAENEDSSYIAYVSQQNLVADGEHGPVDHPQIDAMFEWLDQGGYRLRAIHRH